MSETTTNETVSETAQDERLHERYEGRLEASLLIDDDQWRCWIRDISLGGAGLEPEIPAALGRTVRLSSPFFDFDDHLVGRVINVADHRTCLAFDLDPTLRKRLETFLSANTT